MLGRVGNRWHFFHRLQRTGSTQPLPEVESREKGVMGNLGPDGGSPDPFRSRAAPADADPRSIQPAISVAAGPAT